MDKSMGKSWLISICVENLWNVDGTCTVSETVTNYMAQCMAKLVPIWKINIYITGPYRNIECMEYG
jgi:hypothetical protein